MRRLVWWSEWPVGVRSRETTPAGVVRTLGRVALWGVIALLLVRGAAAVMASGPPDRRESRVILRPSAAWPDDRARAFAVSFARAYMTYLPGRLGRYERGLAHYMPAELVDAVLPRFARHRGGQAVVDAVVARVARLDAGRALITVSVLLTGELSPRVLAVPVGRDSDGALSVFDAPSFEPAPPLGGVGPPETAALSGPEAAAMTDVLERFFRSFLAGDAEGLRYLVAVGSRIGALAQAHELVAVDSIGVVGGAGRARRVVVVGVRARDVRSRAGYRLRYRVVLVRTDRWYVAAVNSVAKEG